MLAMLYKELCRATKSDKMSIDGCLLLLQAWTWWRLLFLRPRVDDLYTFPLVTSYMRLPEQLEDIRLLLAQHTETDFEWMPHADLDIIKCIQPEFLAIQSMWDVKVPIIVYTMVEMYQLDRVMRQLG
ncbi:hypothetical protein PVK06_003158 [Gossypium arboreum]|uniref:Aminotransferase-like plant mobile domain-containing protein n=1 Tax=Gossypium arboreum TaxID=29729 RepID=A0ABR0R6N2_GOSAR|nr:hypothetical protein PVK06_003158 [Gossypium arboreum]